MAIDVGEILIRVRADTKGANRGFGAFARQTDARLVRLSKNLDQFSKRLTGIRAIATAALGPAILKIGSDFDKAITNVRAITKETESQFEATRKGAIAVADEYGRSATEVGGALFQIVSAGLRGAAAFETLKAATATAKAGLVDTAVATDVLVGTLNAFQIEGNQAAEVAGKLIGVVDRGILTFEGLAAKLGNVSPVAAAAGLELEELLGILALLTRNGVRFAQATTQTRGAIVKLVAPGKEARKAIEALLGTTIEASIANRGFIDTLEAVVKASDGSIASFKKLFEDVEAVQGIAAISSAGFAQLREDIEALSNAGNATLVKTTQIQSKSLAQLTVSIRSLVQNQVIRFFEQYRDIILGAAQGIDNFLRNNGAMVQVLVQSTAALAAFAAGGIALGLALKGVVFAFNAYRTVLTSVNILQKDSAAAAALNTVANATNTKGLLANVTARNLQNTATAENTAVTALNTGTVAATSVAQLQLAAGTTVSTVAMKTQTVAVTTNATAMFVLGQRVGLLALAMKAGAASAVAYTVALAGLAAQLAIIAGVAFISFRAGQGIRRKFDTELVEAEALVEKLKEIDKQQVALIKRAQSKQVTDRASRQIEVLNDVAELQKKLKEARGLARGGDSAAAADIERINKRLKEIAPTAKQAQADIGKTYSDLVQQIKNARQALVDEQDGAGIGGTSNEASNLFGNPEDTSTQQALIRAGMADNAEQAVELLKRFQQVKTAYGEITDKVENDTQVNRDNENARIAGNATLTASATLLGNVRDEAANLSDVTARSLLNNAVNEFDDLVASSSAVDESMQSVKDQIGNINQVLARNAAFNFLDAQEVIEYEATLIDLNSTLDDFQQGAANIGISIGNIAAAAIDAAEASRVGVLETVNDLETELLQKTGKTREAADRVADKRVRLRLKAQRELWDAEQEAIENLLAQRLILIEQDAIGNAAEIAQLEEAITLRRDTQDVIVEKLDLIDEINAAEKKNNAERQAEEQKRLDDEQKKKAQIALEEEANAERLLVLQALRDNNITDELNARERLVDIELELLALKDRNLETELATIDATKERIELLRQQLDDARRGGREDQFEGLTRDAIRDLSGGAGNATDRDDVRERLENINTQEGLDATTNATRTALETLFTDLESQRQKAIEDGDVDKAEELAGKIRELIEFWRIFQEEVADRSREIADIEEERQRLEAENADQPAPGQDGSTLNGPPEPEEAPLTGTGTAQPVSTPATPETPQTPATTPTTAPAQGADPTVAVRDAATAAQAALKTATAQLNSTITVAVNAINNMATETINGFTAVNNKLEELTDQTNSNTEELIGGRRRIEDLRITKGQ